MPSDERATRSLPPSPGRVAVDANQRRGLSSAWEVSSTPPGKFARPSELSGAEWIGARVPGTAAGALRDAGLWAHGDGRDFDAEDWWFRTTFESEPASAEEEVYLGLDGVATVHEVFLNDELVGAGESMFAPVEIDVGAALRAGRNELVIRCVALGDLLGAKRKPRARWRTRVADNRLRFFRTMLLGRCPGFAAEPAAVGPWRPVWLERRRALTVSGVALKSALRGEDGVVELQIACRGVAGVTASAADLVLAGAVEAEVPLDVVPGGGADYEITGSAVVPKPPLWWPHTHGEPALAEVFVRVATSNGTVTIDLGRIGFRDLKPVSAPAFDPVEDGIDLHVNGVRTFARGAIWTPVDFVGMAPSEEELRSTLDLARGAGMNIVRVPGTGAYEAASFYDMCDELGMLVWQDFAFANFDYPIEDEPFRAAVEAEASAAIAAIAGRPSLAVLCGNSEVEQQAAMFGLDPALGRGELFGRILPDAVRRSGVDAAYLPSAPCGGSFPFRTDLGVTNYFGVGGYRRPLSDARLAAVRFASECLAFANVPDQHGVEAVIGESASGVFGSEWKAGVPRDSGASWDFDDVRDHYLASVLDVDPDELRVEDPQRYLELSREISGRVMAAVFGEWRRPASTCAGGIVLWLRDLRPGAGWGLIESSGRAKPALDRLAEALAPQAIWMTDEGLNGIGLHVANDSPETLSATVRLSLYLGPDQLVADEVRPLALAEHSATSFDVEEIVGRFLDVSWVYRFGSPPVSRVVATLETVGGDGSERIVSRACFRPSTISP